MSAGWGAWLAALAWVGPVAGCTESAPHARAQRIGALDEAIGGPHAIGRVGDFLLENDQIRLVISKPGPGRPSPTVPSRVRVIAVIASSIVSR